MCPRLLRRPIPIGPHRSSWLIRSLDQVGPRGQPVGLTGSISSKPTWTGFARTGARGAGRWAFSRRSSSSTGTWLKHFMRYERQSASPGMARAMVRLDVRGRRPPHPATIRVPTLRPSSPRRQSGSPIEHGRDLAARIPGARLHRARGVRRTTRGPVIPGPMLAEIQTFVTGDRAHPGAGPRPRHGAVHGRRRLDAHGSGARRRAVARAARRGTGSPDDRRALPRPRVAPGRRASSRPRWPCPRRPGRGVDEV